MSASSLAFSAGLRSSRLRNSLPSSRTTCGAHGGAHRGGAPASVHQRHFAEIGTGGNVGEENLLAAEILFHGHRAGAHNEDVVDAIGGEQARRSPGPRLSWRRVSAPRPPTRAAAASGVSSLPGVGSMGLSLGLARHVFLAGIVALADHGLAGADFLHPAVARISARSLGARSGAENLQQVALGGDAVDGLLGFLVGAHQLQRRGAGNFDHNAVLAGADGGAAAAARNQAHFAEDRALRRSAMVMDGIVGIDLHLDRARGDAEQRGPDAHCAGRSHRLP